MRDTVFSLELTHAYKWIGRLQEKAPKQWDSIRRISVTVLNDGNWFIRHIPSVLNSLLKLEEIGIQVKTEMSQWTDISNHPPIFTSSWKDWVPARLVHGLILLTTMSGMGSHVTVVIEGTMSVAGRTRLDHMNKPILNPERQAIVRVVRKGRVHGNEGEKIRGTSWEDKGVEVKVAEPDELVECRRSWRLWG
jgi:hypothetical protein